MVEENCSAYDDPSSHILLFGSLALCSVIELLIMCFCLFFVHWPLVSITQHPQPLLINLFHFFGGGREIKSYVCSTIPLLGTCHVFFKLCSYLIRIVIVFVSVLSLICLPLTHFSRMPVIFTV